MSAVEPTVPKRPAADAFCEVLLPQDESAAGFNALAYADSFCTAFGAHLSGLMFGLVPFYPIASTAAAPEDWIRAQRKANEEAEAAERRMRFAYARLVAANSLKRVDAFNEEVGRICARRARTVDLTVIGWSEGGGSDIERAQFETCLFDSGHAVLVVPAGWRQHAAPRRALVGWNGSREAARALREALPILRHVQLARLVSVDREDSDFGDDGDPSSGAARFLARHGVTVETKRAHSGGREVAALLADEAEHFGAELVVLGGYGHMRESQWALGGVTRGALALARTPMLFAF